MTWTIDDANRELRRLTPESAWIHCADMRRLGATGPCVAPPRNRTQSELLARIEQVRPLTDEVRLDICRAMLVGWSEEPMGSGVLFYAPDRSRIDVEDYVATFGDDGATRLSLIEACETALARYADRKAKKGGDANDRGQHQSQSESLDVAAPGTVHLEGAGQPAVVRCAECNAMLREEQRAIGTDWCGYCYQRMAPRSRNGLCSRHHETTALDARIAAVQPAEPPRHPSDWEVWITPGSES